MDIMFWIMWGMIFLAVIIGLVIWLVDKAHPYKVRIREITGTKVRLIQDTLAKVKMTKEKVEYLGLMSKRSGHDKLPLPKEEVIDYDPKRKKKVLEAWYSDEGGYTYVQDTGKIEGFQPITTKQRAMIVSEIIKKEARKQTDWKQNIPMIIGLGFLVMVFALALIFGPDMLQAYNNAGSSLGEILDKANLILDKASIIESGGQVVTGTPPT